MREAPANNLTFGNHLAKWWHFIDSNFGVWNIPFYEATQKTQANFAIAGNGNHGPYLTDATQFAVCGSFYSQSWTNGSATLTNTVYPAGYVETNGDYVRWWGQSYGNPPSALSPFTTYYKVNVNNGAKTFQLAATPGGSPINMTDSGSSSGCETAVLHQSNMTSINPAPLGNGYMQNETGAMNWWSAVGGRVDSTTLTDMQNNLSALGGYVDNTPKYAFTASF